MSNFVLQEIVDPWEQSLIQKIACRAGNWFVNRLIRGSISHDRCKFENGRLDPGDETRDSVTGWIEAVESRNEHALRASISRDLGLLIIRVWIEGAHDRGEGVDYSYVHARSLASATLSCFHPQPLISIAHGAHYE